MSLLPLGCGASETAASTPDATAVHAPAAATPSKSGFAPLVGRWMRSDANYVLEIRGAGDDGKLDAGYFNPQPIHVASARASITASRTTVLVELRDQGYPGSTYTLTFDATLDQLRGEYFQAAEQQLFEVLFARAR
ncbi:MAG: hypothetical protein ACKVWV_06285 [Planctomycetota bacterium]